MPLILPSFRFSDPFLAAGHVTSGVIVFFSGLAPTWVVYSWHDDGRNGQPSVRGKTPQTLRCHRRCGRRLVIAARA
jgi:hypothetical protein